MITGLFFTDLYNFKCLLLVNINFEFEINYIYRMKEKNLFPSIEPREKGFLQVSKIHSIYWERSGNPKGKKILVCLLYTSPSPRDQRGSRMPSSA